MNIPPLTARRGCLPGLDVHSVRPRKNAGGTSGVWLHCNRPPSRVNEKGAFPSASALTADCRCDLSN